MSFSVQTEYVRGPEKWRRARAWDPHNKVIGGPVLHGYKQSLNRAFYSKLKVPADTGTFCSFKILSKLEKMDIFLSV